jgi:hypothetical protein
MKSPSISGEAFAGKPAYVGKSLHVAVDALSRDQRYSVWTNDGENPIAYCVDAGTAHLLAAAPDLADATRDLLKAFRDCVGAAAFWEFEQGNRAVRAAQRALAKVSA